jgi:hypothetical protein
MTWNSFFPKQRLQSGRQSRSIARQDLDVAPDLT